MRKEYGKVLRTLFSAEMKRIANHFEEVKVKSIYFWLGDRAYCWRCTEQLYCWIVLSPSKKDYDEFTVLVGWSKQARYPELSMVPCADRPTPNRDEFTRDEYLTRLPSLYTNEDKWWVVRKFQPPRTTAEMEETLAAISATEARKVVTSSVEDAITKVREVGLPYLGEFVRFVKENKG